MRPELIDLALEVRKARLQLFSRNAAWRDAFEFLIDFNGDSGANGVDLVLEREEGRVKVFSLQAARSRLDVAYLLIDFNRNMRADVLDLALELVQFCFKMLHFMLETLAV